MTKGSRLLGAITVTFRDPTAGRLEDTRGPEVVEIAGNGFAADVDVKRALLFRLAVARG